MTDYLDSDTVALALAPSALDEAVFDDLETVTLLLTTSALEERQRYDTGTASFKLTPSGLEQRISTDAATIPLAFTITSIERFGPLLLAFSSVVQQKWDVTNLVRKWESSSFPVETQKKWSVTYAGKVSDVPTG